MTDNVAITAGTGTTIATDDVSGVQYQRIKLTDGTADSDTPAIVDANGSLQVTGKGTAGSEDAGVLTVQGIASMTAVQVDVRRVNGSAVNVADYDTGASTKNVVLNGIALPGDGGPVAGGTSTNPVRVDPTGDTTQPVSISGTVPVSATALPLPTGAATETTLSAIKTAVEGTVDVSLTDNSQVTDNAAFTDGTTKVGMAGYVYDDTAGTALTENDAAAARIDDKRSQVMVIEDASTRGQRVAVDSNGSLKVSLNDFHGSSVSLTGSGILRVVPVADSNEGLNISRVISAASTNATAVKTDSGCVHTIVAFNTNAAVRYLKLYNKASAPTVGTDTPVMTFAIPGNSAGAGFVLNTDGQGIKFSTGIALALTTGIADSDTAAVAANEIVVNILYK